MATEAQVPFLAMAGSEFVEVIGGKELPSVTQGHLKYFKVVGAHTYFFTPDLMAIFFKV